MKTVWKYKLDPYSELDVPKDGKILNVDSVNDEIFIWILVDPKNPKEKREFLSLGTGHPMGDEQKLEYVGTSQIYKGALIFHTFEKIK